MNTHSSFVTGSASQHGEIALDDRRFINPIRYVNRTEYDRLGRTVRSFENYVDGVVGSDNDKKTEYGYGPAGMTSLRAYTTDTASQTTQWNYGFVSGSLITNDAVSSTWWPDATTGAASAAEAETVAINALGQTIASTDRNGNEHTLSYDVLGRLTDDAVTMLGTDVDGAVRRISLEYDGRGNAYRISSYDSPTGGAIVNQVERGYNGLGQMTSEWQAVSGAVTVNTPRVQYGYTEMDGGNHSRATGMTYPNGRMISYQFAGRDVQSTDHRLELAQIDRKNDAHRTAS
jgi:YD repeat-containing protein